MRLTEVVMKVLADHLSPGEVEKLRGIFPPELRSLWPASERTTDLSELD
jgi:uncharacterized protein (DUF2267 family)